MTTQPLWWQKGVIYQIYPRSFQDSNHDGIGDLCGILQRLDYLVDLGIDALWISPFYPSPMADFGYDVSDYTNVDPLFGTLHDFDCLIATVHALGLKLILDFVPNHTSSQHPWFLESRSSRTNPKRDWYLWRDPAPNSTPGNPIPPNNWTSQFGGPAWTFDQNTNQFYCHSFLKEQPDLNWRNPEVRSAIYAAMRFWLERGPGGRGVDGFRMDVLWLLIKDDQFRDNIPGSPTTFNANQPETVQVAGEMRHVMDQYDHVSPRVLIGEIYLPIPELVRYYGTPQSPAAQLPFNFHLIQIPWQAADIAALITQYEASIPAGAWPNYVLGNHDQPRLASRIGASQALVAAFLLFTLRGTPTLYYGDELALPNAQIAPDQIRDPAELNQPNQGHGRDPERSPIPWQNQQNAGFTDPNIPTWLPFVQNWPAYSVETQLADPDTPLKLYKSLLSLRRQHPALHSGNITNITAANGVLTYTRTLACSSFQMHLNLPPTEQQSPTHPGQIILSTHPNRPLNQVSGTLTLAPNEALILRIS